MDDPDLEDYNVDDVVQRFTEIANIQVRHARIHTHTHARTHERMHTHTHAHTSACTRTHTHNGTKCQMVPYVFKIVMYMLLFFYISK